MSKNRLFSVLLELKIKFKSYIRPCRRANVANAKEEFTVFKKSGDTSLKKKLRIELRYGQCRQEYSCSLKHGKLNK